MIDVKVNIDPSAAVIAIKKASRSVAAKLALQTEAYAKINIDKPFEHVTGDRRGKSGKILPNPRGQVDTGAMRNTTRAVVSSTELMGEGRFEFGDQRLPYGVDAMVISPQYYAPYQEAIRAFLWPAALQAMEDFPGVVSEVRKEFGTNG